MCNAHKHTAHVTCSGVRRQLRLDVTLQLEQYLSLRIDRSGEKLNVKQNRKQED